MLIISVGMPFYKLHLLKMAGEKVLSLVKKRNIITYGAAVTSYALLILSVAVDFERFNFVFPYCAVLALYITTREGTLKPINGVYKNLMIVGTEVVRFDDIESIAPQDPNQPDYVMTVVTKNRGKRNITFDNANELKEVEQIIISRC